MSAWTIIAGIALLCVALGAAFDRLVLLNRHKNSIHLRMLEWWNTLDETKIPDIPRLMADWVISVFKPVFRWNIFSWKMIFFCFLASWILTTISAQIGCFITDKKFPCILPYFNYYVVNFPFDFITIIITIKVLHVVKNNSYIISLIAIFTDIILAAITMVCCFSFIMYTNRIIEKYEYLQIFDTSGYHTFKEKEKEIYLKYIKEKIFEYSFIVGDVSKSDIFLYDDILYSLYESPKFMMEILFKGNYYDATKKFGSFIKARYIIEEKDTYGYYTIDMIVKKIEEFTWTILLVSGTTFIPTFFYMGLLLIMLIAKIILESSRFITMHIIEVVTEDPKNFMPGTLFGILCSVIASLAKLMIDIIKTYYGIQNSPIP